MEAVFTYLDDILIASLSFELHLQDLNEVFRRLEDINMTINGEKSSLLKPEIEYLGFILNAEGCTPNPDKVKAILDLDRPSNKKTLRKFIGMVNHIRRHLPGLSAILAPLTLLSGSNIPFNWRTTHEESFNRTKELLASAALLRHPDFDQPFLIYTDASDFAYGGVILQCQAKSPT